MIQIGFQINTSHSVRLAKKKMASLEDIEFIFSDASSEDRSYLGEATDDFLEESFKEIISAPINEETQELIQHDETEDKGIETTTEAQEEIMELIPMEVTISPIEISQEQPNEDSIQVKNIENQKLDNESIEALIDFLNPNKNKIKSSKKTKKEPKAPPVPRKVDFEEPHPKRIRRSKNHINNMITRLSQPAKPKLFIDDEELKRPKTVCDPKAFDRLYEISKEKEKKAKELQKQHEVDEIADNIKHAHKVNKKSEELAAGMFNKFVLSAFEPLPELITKDELVNTLAYLGLLDNKQTLESLPMIEEELNKWKDDEDKFQTELIKNDFVNLTESQLSTPFQKLAHKQIVIALVNGKTKKQTNQSDEPKVTKHMKKETFDRLTKIKQDYVPQKKEQSNDKPRPKFIPKKHIDDPIPEVKISDVSSGIWQSSEVAHMSIEERDRLFQERRNKKLKQLQEEYYQPTQNSKTQSNKMEVTEEMKKKIFEKKEQKRRELEQGPSFRPNVTSYKDYLKIRRSQLHNTGRPEGWDEYVNRRRTAYQKYLEKKEEEERDIDLLEIRANKRKCLAQYNADD